MATQLLPRLGRLGRLGPLGRLPAVLTWPAPVDAYTRLVDPLSTTTGFRARVEAVVPETDRATTLVLRPGPGFPPHRPGQWVALGVDIDGVRHTRCYSLTSVPGRPDGCISVTIQAVPDGVVSNHVADATRVGDVVHLDAPDGDFVLPAVRTAPLLFITGGSGITPVMGMLRTLAGARSMGDVVLLHHAPGTGDVIFARELEDLARRCPTLRVDIALTGPGAPPPDAALTAGRLDRVCPDWRRREAWVCGPAPLLDAADALWAGSDVTGQLHVERFAPPRPVTDGVGGRVTFGRSGTTVSSDGTRTLLDLAEAADLTPVSGCRMGVCQRCVVPLRSGTVRDLRDGRTESEPGAYVQICVSSACGDVELEC